MFYLVLKMWAGLVMLGHYDTEAECKQGAAEHIAMLTAQASDERHNASVACVHYEAPLPQPREFANS